MLASGCLAILNQRHQWPTPEKFIKFRTEAETHTYRVLSLNRGHVVGEALNCKPGVNISPVKKWQILPCLLPQFKTCSPVHRRHRISNITYFSWWFLAPGLLIVSVGHSGDLSWTGAKCGSVIVKSKYCTEKHRRIQKQDLLLTVFSLQKMLWMHVITGTCSPYILSWHATILEANACGVRPPPPSHPCRSCVVL